MAIETTASNSALIQSQVQQLLVAPLEQASSFLAAGPVLIDSSSPVRIPRIANGVNAGFVAEGATIPDGDVGIDEVSLLPSNLKGLKTIVKFTNELLRQSVIGLDAVLKTRLITDVSNALDTALFTGSGAGNTIRGLINQTGVQTGVLSASDPDSLLDGIALAHAENVTPNRWFLNPADYISLRKLHKGTGDKSYVLDPDVHADTVYTLFGIPVTVTNKLPVGKAVLADMNFVVVVRDVDAEVFLIDQLYAAEDSQGIRVVTRYDVGLLQPKAVAVLTATP